MSVTRRKLGPPKGADDAATAARLAMLGSRFTVTSNPDPEPVAATQTSEPVDSSAKSPKGSVERTTKRRPRSEPPGMTRRTYYYSLNAAEAFNAAVERITHQLGGQVPKHEIINALMQAAVSQEDGVGLALRTELLSRLSPDPQ